MLTFYAMAGVWRRGDGHHPGSRFHWIPLVAGGAVFAISAGVAALAVLRLEARGPLMLMLCAAVGAALCIAMPAAVRDAAITRDMWIASIAGGLLFAAFLLLAARFIRLYLRSIG